MKISVITSVFNESIDVIKLCIDSVLNQSIKNFEYIIVDDNPNSLKLYNFLKREENKDTRIKILRNDTNLGLVKSLNRGLNYSTGDYIARVDADDISKKSRLENQLEFLKKNNLDFVCSNAKIIDENGRTIHTRALGNRKIVSQKIIKFWEMFVYMKLNMLEKEFFKLHFPFVKTKYFVNCSKIQNCQILDFDEIFTNNF